MIAAVCFRRFHIHITTRYSNARQQETARACDYFGAGPHPEKGRETGFAQLAAIGLCLTGSAALPPALSRWSGYSHSTLLQIVPFFRL